MYSLDSQLLCWRRTKADESWPPKFTKLHVTFHDGTELAFTNIRRLGRIGLLSKLGGQTLLDFVGEPSGRFREH